MNDLMDELIGKRKELVQEGVEHAIKVHDAGVKASYASIKEGVIEDMVDGIIEYWNDAQEGSHSLSAEIVTEIVGNQEEVILQAVFDGLKDKGFKITEGIIENAWLSKELGDEVFSGSGNVQRFTDAVDSGDRELAKALLRGTSGGGGAAEDLDYIISQYKVKEGIVPDEKKDSEETIVDKLTEQDEPFGKKKKKNVANDEFMDDEPAPEEEETIDDEPAGDEFVEEEPEADPRIAPEGGVGEPDPGMEQETEAEPEEPEIAKEYFGKLDDTHFYLVQSEVEEGGEPDLQILDQEGKLIFSAKENNLDVNDVFHFIVAATQEIKPEGIMIDIFHKYVVPKIEEYEKQEEEEILPDEEQLETDEDIPKDEMPFESRKRLKEGQGSDIHIWHDPVGGSKFKVIQTDEDLKVYQDDQQIIDWPVNGKVNILNSYAVADGFVNVLMQIGEESSDDQTEPSFESKVLSEVKVVFDRREFEVNLIEDNSSKTVLSISGKLFNFSPNFIKMFRNVEGKISEDSLKELALDALSQVDEETFDELASRAAKVDQEIEEEVFAPDRHIDKIAAKVVKSIAEEEKEKTRAEQPESSESDEKEERIISAQAAPAGDKKNTTEKKVAEGHLGTDDIVQIIRNADSYPVKLYAKGKVVSIKGGGIVVVNFDGQKFDVNDDDVRVTKQGGSSSDAATQQYNESLDAVDVAKGVGDLIKQANQSIKDGDFMKTADLAGKLAQIQQILPEQEMDYTGDDYDSEENKVETGKEGQKIEISPSTEEDSEEYEKDEIVDEGIVPDEKEDSEETIVDKLTEEEAEECPHCRYRGDMEEIEDKDDTGNVGVFPKCPKCGQRTSDIARYWKDEKEDESIEKTDEMCGAEHTKKKKKVKEGIVPDTEKDSEETINKKLTESDELEIFEIGDMVYITEKDTDTLIDQRTMVYLVKESEKGNQMIETSGEDDVNDQVWYDESKVSIVRLPQYRSDIE